MAGSEDARTAGNGKLDGEDGDAEDEAKKWMVARDMER